MNTCTQLLSRVPCDENVQPQPHTTSTDANSESDGKDVDLHDAEQPNVRTRDHNSVEKDVVKAVMKAISLGLGLGTRLESHGIN